MRQRRLMLATFCALLPNAAGQTKAPASKASEPKPMDYILEHLSRAKGKPVSSEPLDPGPYHNVGIPLSLRELNAVDDCTLSLRFDRFIFNDVAIFSREEFVSLNLRDAELNGPSASGSLVTIRMLVPAKVSSRVRLVSKDGKAEPELNSVDDRYTLTLPASDEGDAKRLARAFNEQIRLCGGKADPFAK